EHSPELRGTMESLTAPEKQTLEENFTEGLERWTGGASGWKIDVAGVRVGPTALFIPSLNLKNYDLEFLARVEAGGLTCLFRASSGEKAHTLGMLAGARGVSLEAAGVSIPVDLAGGARAAFTVQLSARGNDFVLAIDGKPLHQWTDASLPSGGVGFRASSK